MSVQSTIRAVVGLLIIGTMTVSGQTKQPAESSEGLAFPHRFALATIYPNLSLAMGGLTE